MTRVTRGLSITLEVMLSGNKISRLGESACRQVRSRVPQGLGLILCAKLEVTHDTTNAPSKARSLFLDAQFSQSVLTFGP